MDLQQIHVHNIIIQFTKIIYCTVHSQDVSKIFQSYYKIEFVGSAIMTECVTTVIDH